MKLFLVVALHAGENMDLFVWAANAFDALGYWTDYYAGWEKPTHVKVWPVPTQGMIGAVPWDILSGYEAPVPDSREARV